MPNFEAKVVFGFEDDITLEQAKEWLDDAFSMDVNTEDNDNPHGFEAVELSWPNLHKVDPKTNHLGLLKQFGFAWFKDNCTDKVSHDCIADVVPAANGFTVIYNDKSVLVMSTAVVAKIEYPPDGELDKKWILVHWESIKDERKSENASDGE